MYIHCRGGSNSGNDFFVDLVMDIKEQIRDIKTQFRLSMNGVASHSMRERGLDYKLNFGVELPRLKEIASHYEKNHELAQTLWKENVRESKILAGMLQPIDTFYPEIADIWVEDMHYPEIAEITCMTLFQYLPYASEKAFEWMADDREHFQYCGFLLMARLLGRDQVLGERPAEELLDQAQTAILSEPYYPRKAAALALKKYALQSSTNASRVRKILGALELSGKDFVLPICQEIRFEIE